MKKKEKVDLGNIKCECGYNNLPQNAYYWGTCTRCGKVIDERTYFKKQMANKLRLWRDKRR